jgi:hypothetical protein
MTQDRALSAAISSPVIAWLLVVGAGRTARRVASRTLRMSSNMICDEFVDGLGDHRKLLGRNSEAEHSVGHYLQLLWVERESERADERNQRGYCPHHRIV